MTAKNKALALLARQPYTSRRLADKLRNGGFEQQEVEEAIEWCVGEGYLNDAEWAGRKAAQKAQKGWDRRKIAAYLRHYGISREDITDALEALETDEYE
ncbi:MAG: recombination regulator RecX [Oscillospiraceae bacterium]|jgi:regulatory protein|nr:recombination regulator RecX [Oscillospiraceae bacterium]